jgi:hypothetical protein
MLAAKEPSSGSDGDSTYSSDEGSYVFHEDFVEEELSDGGVSEEHAEAVEELKVHLATEGNEHLAGGEDSLRKQTIEKRQKNSKYIFSETGSNNPFFNNTPITLQFTHLHLVRYLLSLYSEIFLFEFISIS